MTISVEQRRRVWEREEGRCGICGEAVAFDEMHLDHIVPDSHGGKAVPENLRPAHRQCNSRRGNGHVKRTVVGERPIAYLIRPTHARDIALWERLMAEARTERRSLTGQLFKVIEQWFERRDASGSAPS